MKQGLKLNYFSGQDAFQPRDRIPRTPAKTEPSGKNGFIVGKGDLLLNENDIMDVLSIVLLVIFLRFKYLPMQSGFNS